jgi:hypothetical protein
MLSVCCAKARPAEWEIRHGKLYVKGEWVFLKTAKPLRDFSKSEAVDQLIADLDILRQKNFNCIEVNCYWHHFDKDGDGTIDVDTVPLRKLIDAIHARGMFPCLSVETYGVGGGRIPEPFIKANPDCVAINSAGAQVKDDEYGFHSVVPSLFHDHYLNVTRRFIRNLTGAIDFSKILYFETTVEPQFMGKWALDYSPAAKIAYEAWRKSNPDAPPWPDRFPIPEEFVADKHWNCFRAQSLARWVNEDAAAFQAVAGKDACIAVDYLETCGPDMRNRNGDSLTFLRELTCASIIQVNWHWNANLHQPNTCAYKNIRQVMRETNRDWAITEHMTINGTDYVPEDMENLLRNTIRNSTQFGWEFVDVSPKGEFSVYGENWQPKPTMKVVDDRWVEWLKEIREQAKKANEERR